MTLPKLRDYIIRFFVGSAFRKKLQRFTHFRKMPSGKSVYFVVFLKEKAKGAGIPVGIQ